MKFYWLSKSWWQWILAKPLTWKKLICRIKYHPNGVEWYSHGLEPDMHCVDCGDKIG